MLFLSMALLIIVTVAGTYWTGQHAIGYARAVIDVNQTIYDLHDILSLHRAAESGQRGYVLTGDPDYLDPYNRSESRIPDEIKDLDAHAKQGDLAQADVDQIRRLSDLKIAEMQKTIDLRGKPGGFDAAAALVRTGVGRQEMEGLRTLVRRMIDDKTQEVEGLENSWVRVTYVRSFAFAAAAVIDLAFLVWAYSRIRSEIRDRQIVAENLARQERQAAVTLASIGDAVIVTDADCRITFLNHVAEKLTGWSTAEAIGKPCTTVFNVINETTRQLARNPVEWVMRTGLVQGLANHTLLIRRDGSELPIDDSGAPIRGEDGAIHGAVLVFRDFTERKQFEHDLQKAKEDAEAANLAKDNFLAALSHELRTPLTPVLVTLTSWEQSREIPESLRDEIQTLRRCVELEARLIDDLLDLTRIARGKLPLHLEDADVHGLLLAVMAMYRSDLDAKAIRVSTQLAASTHFASADPGRLQQVFWNILKNAVKFTPHGGAIAINSGNSDDGRLQIAFTDSGAGMSPQTIARVFQPFQQGSAEIARRYGGLGLGMTISKAFIEAHGGRIEATSPGVGMGSTFTLSLPTIPQPVRAPSPPSVPPSDDGDRKQLEILLVEDHEDTSRVLSRLLQRLGHHVRVADSVAAGIAAASAQPFDLLLSDIGLPDGTGIELIQSLRNEHHLTVPAVALTGFGMEEDIAKSQEAGFTEHLTKPINFQRLQLMIQKIVDSR